MSITKTLFFITGYVKMYSTAPVLYPRNVGGGGGSVGTLTITWDVSIHLVCENYL